jgi:hypothetical protein
MSCFIEGSSVGGHVGQEETINFVQVFQKWDRVGCFPRELALNYSARSELMATKWYLFVVCNAAAAVHLAIKFA